MDNGKEENKQEKENNTTQTENVAPRLVASAYAAVEQLKEENARMEANIKRLEELKAFEMLGGKSEGRPQEEQPQEIDPLTYSKMVMAGKLPLKK